MAAAKKKVSTQATGFEVTLTFERSTKGTHVFAGGEDAPIRSLYIAKATFGENPPAKLRIVATGE